MQDIVTVQIIYGHALKQDHCDVTYIYYLFQMRTGGTIMDMKHNKTT